MPVTIDAWRITGQSQIDSYVGRWVELAVLLVNELAVTHARGRRTQPPADPKSALETAFAQQGWSPTSAAAADRAPGDRMVGGAGLSGGGAPDRPRISAADADRLAGVAAGLRPVFTGAPDTIDALNQALVRHGAVPNLRGDPPILAFHAPGADLVDAWASDAATALAMVIGVGQAVRLRTCEAAGCELVFFDVTRNASRRFCGLACQNRAKATAYRARRRT